MSKWSGVVGNVSVEIEGPDTAPECLKSYFSEDDLGELTIEFESSGSSYPGSFYKRNGDPGDPPEHDEEREITSAKLKLTDCNTGNTSNIVLPKGVYDALYSFCEEDINGVELEYAHDEPDYD